MEWLNCKGTSFSVKVLVEQTNKFIPNDKRSENKCTKMCLAAVLCFSDEITCHMIQMCNWIIVFKIVHNYSCLCHTPLNNYYQFDFVISSFQTFLLSVNISVGFVCIKGHCPLSCLSLLQHTSYFCSVYCHGVVEHSKCRLYANASPGSENLFRKMFEYWLLYCVLQYSSPNI